MRAIVCMLALATGAWLPSRLAAQAWGDAGVLRRAAATQNRAVGAKTLRDTVAAPVDNRPTIGGSIFVGSLVWYPGALTGFLFTADAACFDGPCSSSSKVAMAVGVFGGGGLLTGLVVGAIARTSPHCTRGQAIRAAILGAEIGSFGTAGVTGLLANRPIHDAPAITALALPVVSAAGATLMTRHCRTA